MIINATQDKMREYVFELISKVKNEKIIELGCNTGNFAELLKDSNIDYTGIDIQSDKIEIAKNNLKNMNFICCNIIDNLYLLKNANIFISFQCLEHIEKDLDILKSLPSKCKVFISVPNKKYKGHIRWFEVDGWTERFKKYINFENIITFQHPQKKNTRTFLFIGEKDDNKN
jgi:2-polyprenyl-3-methyl-5-hydroxy-6-metoxy-1,4-benzoquinol methylase